MPKVAGRVLSLKDDGGKRIVTVQLNAKVPKIGALVEIKWGARRSLPQNALYWTFLTWLIDHGGMKEQGHFSPEGLHLSLKEHFLSEKIFDKGKFKAIEEATTTDLTKAEFSEYFDKINEFMKDFFEIDTTPFWKDHEDYAL